MIHTQPAFRHNAAAEAITNRLVQKHWRRNADDIKNSKRRKMLRNYHQWHNTDDKSLKGLIENLYETENF